MIKEDIIADLHIHTVASGHAYSTLKECIVSAIESGMRYIAITDHYYNDGSDLEKKNEINRIIRLEARANHTKENITIFGGAEFNIGQEIANWNKVGKVTWKLIGVHENRLDDEVMLFLRIVKLAKDKNVFLEVNESSLVDNESRDYERMRYWLQLVKENGNLISL